MFNDEILLKSQQGFRSDHHNVYTVEINETALSSNDDKRLQTFDKIITYPYGSNTFKACKREIMIVKDFFVKDYTDSPFYYEIISIRKKRIQSMRKGNAK